jgi:hypothetical protein
MLPHATGVKIELMQESGNSTVLRVPFRLMAVVGTVMPFIYSPETLMVAACSVLRRCATTAPPAFDLRSQA